MVRGPRVGDEIDLKGYSRKEYSGRVTAVAGLRCDVDWYIHDFKTGGSHINTYDISLLSTDRKCPYIILPRKQVVVIRSKDEKKA